MLRRSSLGVDAGNLSSPSSSERSIAAIRTFVSVSASCSSGMLKWRATTGRICIMPTAPRFDTKSSLKRVSLYAIALISLQSCPCSCPTLRIIGSNSEIVTGSCAISADCSSVVCVGIASLLVIVSLTISSAALSLVAASLGWPCDVSYTIKVAIEKITNDSSLIIL